MFSQIGANRQYNQNFLTFNSLNSYILKGDGALGMELTFATLMARSGDEPDAMYGLAARAVRIADDGLTYRFLLRAEADIPRRQRAHRARRRLVADDAEGEGPSDHHPAPARHAGRAGRPTTAPSSCASRRSAARDVPLFVAGLPIFSRAYYAKQQVRRNRRSTCRSAAAPTRSATSTPAASSNIERVKDWWGADLPVAQGQNNFDVVRYEYYRDRDVAFEGFTAGSYLFREEFTSRVWATRYNFPAFKDGRVKRDVMPDDTPSGAQGWFINTRRAKFKDRRLREALIDAFDFEWTNKNLMYGSYERTQSVFENSPMKAVGKPSAAELKLLEPFRGKVPDEVFGEPYVPPVTDGSGQDRRWLRRGAQLLTAGGLSDQGRQAGDAGRHADRDRIPDRRTDLQAASYDLYQESRDARLRRQLAHRRSGAIPAPRVDNFDFDITVERFSFSATPGDSLRSYFSSQAAATKGSQNLAGIADPVIDALIDAAIAAKTARRLTAACRALDRVFRAGRYWIPHWYKASHWIAYWDEFGHPAAQPRYSRGIPATWWYDAAQGEEAGAEGLANAHRSWSFRGAGVGPRTWNPEPRFGHANRLDSGFAAYRGAPE